LYAPVVVGDPLMLKDVASAASDNPAGIRPPAAGTNPPKTAPAVWGWWIVNPVGGARGTEYV
jgi:hypothetical protein